MTMRLRAAHNTTPNINTGSRPLANWPMVFQSYAACRRRIYNGRPICAIGYLGTVFSPVGYPTGVVEIVYTRQCCQSYFHWGPQVNKDVDGSGSQWSPCHSRQVGRRMFQHVVWDLSIVSHFEGISFVRCHLLINEVIHRRCRDSGISCLLLI